MIFNGATNGNISYFPAGQTLLIDADDELGRLAPGFLADIIAVPGDVSRDIASTLNVSFVMKGGQIHKTSENAA